MPENTQIALLTSKSLPELICSELEGWIAQGKVSPGQPLREADISAQMGLSRGPVREAFRILEERGLVCCEKKSVASNTTLDLGLAVFEKDVYINFESVCSNVTIILPEGVNVACDIEKRIAGVHNLVENVDEEGIHTVYVIGKATLSKVDIIPVNFYVDDDDVEDILAEDDFDEEEAFPESGDVDVKVINKSEKEAVSEETVKSEDGFKPADNADTTEDNTETINLEEVK